MVIHVNYIIVVWVCKFELVQKSAKYKVFHIIRRVQIVVHIRELGLESTFVKK